MSNKVVEFVFDKSFIRTMVVRDEPFFVGRDVAQVLGYADTAYAIRTHCKEVEEIPTPSNGGDQIVKIVTQDDVYRLIERSRKVTTLFKERLIKCFQENGFLSNISFTSRNEVEFLETLETLIQPMGYKMVKQYHCSKYRIDSVIDTGCFKVAIEYDESGHSKYDSVEENRREEVIKSTLTPYIVRVTDEVEHIHGCGEVLAEIMRISEMIKVSSYSLNH